MTTAKCGTRSGYQTHRRLGEEACEACLEAARAYQAGRRASIEGREEARLFTKAQSRARQDLVELHRAEYELLYAAHVSDLQSAARRAKAGAL